MSSPATTAGGAREQVGRLLRVVPYLHAHGEVRLDEAAADLAIPQAQLVKDLRVLFLCGLPGGYPDDLIDVDIDALTAPDGDRVVRIANADYLARPLRLNPTEATAVIVALRALRSASTDAATRDVVDRALAKLAHAAEAAPVGALDAGATPEEALLAAVGDTLRRAVAGASQAEIVYFVPSRDEVTTRVVEPVRLVSESGVSYVTAWCHTAGAPRSFRLDRIRSARRLDRPATHLDQVPDVVPGDFGPEDPVETVTLRLAPQAHWVADYYRPSAVRRLDDGAWEIDLRVADPRWLDRLLLRLTPYAVALAPADFAERHLAGVRETLTLYDAAT